MATHQPAPHLQLPQPESYTYVRILIPTVLGDILRLQRYVHSTQSREISLLMNR